MSLVSLVKDNQNYVLLLNLTCHFRIIEQKCLKRERKPCATHEDTAVLGKRGKGKKCVDRKKNNLFYEGRKNCLLNSFQPLIIPFPASLPCRLSSPRSSSRYLSVASFLFCFTFSSIVKTVQNNKQTYRIVSSKEVVSFLYIYF